MADKKATIVTDEQQVIVRARGFWENYSRPIIYIGSAVILIVAGWFGYKYLIKNPKERKANVAVFMAESLFDKMATTSFNKDSSVIILNGGEIDNMKVTGLLSVIKNYSGTMAGNRACYMAGATYLNLKEFDKAVKYLKDFESSGAYQVESKADILLGHAYAEQKNTDEALKYYKKAAEVNEKDDIISSEALLLAASYADAIGKNDEAIKLYQKMKENYPANNQVRSGEIDKYLARLSILK